MGTKMHDHGTVLIRPRNGWAPIDFRELYSYRRLLWMFAWRDVKVRYKQSLFGIAWAVAPPLMTMVVFNVLFGVLMGKSGRPTIAGVPYAISTFCAMVPWQFFANALSNSANSLVSNRALITKIYFPRLIAPIAPVIAALVDFTIAFVVLLGLMVGYHLLSPYTLSLSWTVLMIPLLTVLAALAALSISLWVSALNALYRDIRFVMPFLIQFFMFVTPVIYTSQTVLANQADWVKILYGLNPMVGVVEGFRWALLNTQAPPVLPLLLSCVMVGLFLTGGLFYFRRMERTFSDRV